MFESNFCKSVSVNRIPTCSRIVTENDYHLEIHFPQENGGKLHALVRSWQKLFSSTADVQLFGEAVTTHFRASDFCHRDIPAERMQATSL